MEHHANLVPWQNLAKSTGAVLKFLEVTEDGRLVLDPQKFSVKTKIVSITHQSNVLGTVLPIVEIVELAKKSGAVVVLDACQSVPHMPVDFEKLGVSAAAWSGHKMVGPTGVGCLYLNDDLLEELPPFLMGGNMIETVQFETSTFKSGSYKFEAGTMNVAQAVGLGAAADYLKKLGMDNVHKYEQSLTSKALFGLLEVPGITVLGPKDMKDRGGVVSFVVDQVHPHDVSQYLDSKGIAIRAGHHCAWPLHRLLGAQASSRASFYLYNTRLEVDYFLEAVAEIRQYFKVA
jgi:cysteine desulfurase/selenocysteine lyase